MPLTTADLSPAWVAQLVRELPRPAAAGADEPRLERYWLSSLLDSQGVISRYQPSTEAELVGHRVLHLRGTAAGRGFEREVIIKAKVPGDRLRRRVATAYRRFEPALAEVQAEVSPSILDHSHTRELAIYGLADPRLRAITPQIYRLWTDEARGIFAIVMERLAGVRHEKTLDDLDVWSPTDLTCVVTQLACLHGGLLGTISAAHPPSWLLPFAQLHNASLARYQAALLRYNADTFPALFTAARTRVLEQFLATAGARHRAIMARPLTLIHGDFTPRNVCLRVGARGQLTLCAYDWELAQVDLPQRDVFEFLCYALPPAASWGSPLAAELLAQHRRALAAAAGTAIEVAAFERDLAMAIKEFCTFKLLVQGITHQLLGNRAYFERLVHNSFTGIAVHAADAD